MILEAMDESDRVIHFESRFSNNCEWCGRIRVSKKCEYELNKEARMIARGFK